MQSMNLFSLTGRTALVTGASRGIGLSIAEAFAQAGAQVVLNGRSQASLEAAVRRLEELGLSCGMSVFDVTKPAEVTAAVNAIERSIGPVDILVNNAGIQRRAPLDSFDDDDWRELMAVNVEKLHGEEDRSQLAYGEVA